MKKITAEAIQHIDVRGKKLYYLKLTDGTTEILINVGQKTYDSVTAMTQGPITGTYKIDPETKKGGK